MIDKEKQIEELANCKNCVHQKMCIDKISCGVLTADKDGYLKLKCNYYQPKLPKDSVVLSKEEYERLKGCENTIKRFSKISPTEAESENKALKEEIAIILAQKRRIWELYNQLKEELKQARKETAEKFYQDIQYIINKSDGFLCEEVLRITAKQFGVEVDRK